MASGGTLTEAKRELTIRDRLKDPSMIAEFGKAMPAHCKPDRMARVALTAITKTPKLADCDQASFFQALLSLSQWGLEPDGRRAHLIPFDNKKRGVTECQLIIDYKGYVELAYRSGVVKAIHADVVRDGDIFDFNLGQVVRHTPWFLRRDADKPAKPGEVFAVYCFVELAGGATKTEVLSVDEVESIKKRSSGWQAFEKGYTKQSPWKSDWCEMAKKTAFRRAQKWLPLSAELIEAFDRDDDKIADEDPHNVAVKPQSTADLTALIAGGTDDVAIDADEQQAILEAERGDAAE